MEKHLAVFVSDGAELVGLQMDETQDNYNMDDFCWAEFDWFFDHFFMSVVNELLDRQNPSKVSFGTKQLPRQWAGARHFVISFEKFMLITKNVVQSFPPMDDLEPNFQDFYKWCLRESYDKIRELQENVKGLYKILPDDLYVLFLIKPVTYRQTSIEHLREEWEKRIPKIEDLLAQLKETSDQK